MVKYFEQTKQSLCLNGWVYFCRQLYPKTELEAMWKLTNLVLTKWVGFVIPRWKQHITIHVVEYFF